MTTDDQGGLVDEKGKAVGVLRVLAGPEDVKAAEKEAGRQGVVVVDAQDWQVRGRGTGSKLEFHSTFQELV